MRTPFVPPSNAAPVAFPQAAFLLLAFSLLSGCCGGEKSAERSGTLVQPFTVELSSGGGVSNMHAGHIIHDDGSVLFWQGLNGKHENMRIVGAVTRERIIALKTAADEAALAGLRYSGAGNMTTTLRVTDGDVVAVQTWSGTSADAETVPPELKALHMMILEIIAAAESGADK